MIEGSKTTPPISAQSEHVPVPTPPKSPEETKAQPAPAPQEFEFEPAPAVPIVQQAMPPAPNPTSPPAQAPFVAPPIPETAPTQAPPVNYEEVKKTASPQHFEEIPVQNNQPPQQITTQAEIPAEQNIMKPENPPAKSPMEENKSSPHGEQIHQAFDLGEDEEHPSEAKRERLPSDYDVTEMELIHAREQADMERRANLELKEREEQAKKKAMQEKAEVELKQWADSRKVEILNRREKNKEEEAAFNEARKAQTVAKNPWEKVVTNVDIKEGNYLGSKDVSRMRQSMLSRKNDVKQGIIKFSEDE